MTTSTPEALSNDAADLVIGFRSFGQMPVYRRFGRAVLDHVTGAGGTVTDSQSGFRALNRKAALSLAGTLGRGEIEAFGIGAAEDIKGMGADCVIMAVVRDAFKKTFHKSFIKNCPSGGVCFYIFLYVKVVKRWKQKV